MTCTIVETGGLWHGRMLLFNSLPSTNSWAVQNARDLRHGDVVTAGLQTAGRGRFDRSWIMPRKKAGLALTVALRDTDLDGVSANIGRAAALGVCECLRGFGVRAAVKWPNDVMAGGRKICGMLAEKEAGVVLLGIGLNVNVSRFDFEAAGLDAIATSMLIERNETFDLEKVRTFLLYGLAGRIGGLLRGGPGDLDDAWAAADWLAGAQVEIDTAAGPLRGRYAGVHRDGRLRLADDAGGEQLLWSGDVRKVARR